MMDLNYLFLLYIDSDFEKMNSFNLININMFFPLTFILISMEKSFRSLQIYHYYDNTQ